MLIDFNFGQFSWKTGKGNQGKGKGYNTASDPGPHFGPGPDFEKMFITFQKP